MVNIAELATFYSHVTDTLSLVESRSGEDQIVVVGCNYDAHHVLPEEADVVIGRDRRLILEF